jgi:hypothetical protein
MGLKHLKFEEALVKFAGGEFAVRGLSLEHITFIVRAHGVALNSVFDKIVQKAADPEGEFSAGEVGDMVLPFLQEVPQVAAMIIASGAGDPSDTELARRLPVPVQVEALEQVLRLTFDAEGGPKKFLQTVIRLMKGTQGLLSQLSQPDQSA